MDLYLCLSQWAILSPCSFGERYRIVKIDAVETNLSLGQAVNTLDATFPSRGHKSSWDLYVINTLSNATPQFFEQTCC